MNHAGDIFLASATFTKDQHGELGGGHQFHMFVETHHGGTVTPHPLFVARHEGLLHLLVGRRQRGGDFFFKHAWVDGFLEIVEGTELHGRHSGLHLGIARHHDDGHLAFQLLAHPGHQDDAIAIRKTQIGENQAKVSIGNLNLSLFVPRCQHSLIAILLQPGLNHQAKGGIVFHHKNSTFHGCKNSTFFDNSTKLHTKKSLTLGKCEAILKKLKTSSSVINGCYLMDTTK